MHLYLYVCMCIHVYALSNIHTTHIHTHTVTHICMVCVCIYTRIGRYIYVRAVMGWGLAGSDDMIQGVTHMFIFSPLHLPWMWQEWTQQKSPLLCLQVIPYLLTPLHSHSQASLNEEMTPQRPRLLLAQKVPPRKHPWTLGIMIVLLLWQVGSDLNWDGIREKLVSLCFYFLNFKVIKTV